MLSYRTVTHQTKTDTSQNWEASAMHCSADCDWATSMPTQGNHDFVERALNEVYHSVDELKPVKRAFSFNEIVRSFR